MLQNAYEEFKAVLERFAPAEELTGTAGGEAAETATGEQKAEVCVQPALTHVNHRALVSALIVGSLAAAKRTSWADV